VLEWVFNQALYATALVALISLDMGCEIHSQPEWPTLCVPMGSYPHRSSVLLRVAT